MTYKLIRRRCKNWSTCKSREYYRYQTDDWRCPICDVTTKSDAPNPGSKEAEKIGCIKNERQIYR